ncbi:MAG: DUF3488 domain-containing transglutaminase family protein [Zoogloeaceae bacterium]|nr:DUF3488 domain-containing transglutaminase family protein [Zoogloeaceae bacterium]
MKTRKHAEPLERAAVPWLLTCALATAAPHASHLPVWLSCLVSGVIASRFWLWNVNKPLPSRWLLTLLVIAATAGIALQYRTILGRDAGVALLVLFMALKPMEMRWRRDAIVVVMLGFFLLLTHYLYSQSIPTGLWLMTAATLQTATLVRIYGGSQPPAIIMRKAATMLAQAAPLMLVLFVLFPRVSGPLWGLPQDAHSSRSGLPDSIEPGSISDLVLNGSLAFRVRFEETPPSNSNLYWRGPVMDEFDGRTWRPARLEREPVPKIDALGKSTRYELTLEPQNQRWLLALDAPAALPPDAHLSPRMQALSRHPIRARSRFTMQSVLDYRAGIEESASILKLARQLPAEGNARARALAKSWQEKHHNPAAIAAEALQLFREENFIYTLQPPLLQENSIDQFLYETRRGFCEHYASAFVFLMRAAGVPARIVAGYQGGEINPVDGYLTVRQSDAHAWAEIWVAGRGWQRVDPTAAIAPARVESGIADALPAGESLPVMARVDLGWLRQMRFRWEAINNSWNQWVLGYNPERQREMLSRIGLGEIDWRGMTALLSVICGVLLAAITMWTLWSRSRLDPAQRAWFRCCARLKKLGMPRHPWEGPLAYAERIAKSHAGYGEIALQAASAYANVRYGKGNPLDIRIIAAATKRLPNNWRFT